jgi:endonuclease/exonuclease/phosphatase family metal-dependent hydrolase
MSSRLLLPGIQYTLDRMRAICRHPSNGLSIFILQPLLYVLLSVLASPLSAGGYAEHPELGSTTIRLLTYNVLTHDVGLFDWIYSFIHRSATASERMMATMSLLEREDADIIALQEVTLPFLKLLKAGLPKYHFATTLDPDRGTIAEYLSPPDGLLIMSRWPFTRIDNRPLVASQLGRRMLLITLQAAGYPLQVDTCHLDSFPEEHRTRAEQLHQLFKSLASADNAILLGNFNFGDGEQPETNALHRDFEDPWLSLHPEDLGLTYDVKHNPLAAANAFENESGRRLDRILVRAQDWVATNIHRLDKHPVAIEGKEYYASDHYGVVVTLRLNHEASSKH